MDPVKKNFKFQILSEKFLLTSREVKQNVLLCSASSFRTLYKFIVNFFLVSTTNPWNLLKVFPTGRAGGEKESCASLFLITTIFSQFLLLFDFTSIHFSLPYFGSRIFHYSVSVREIFTGRNTSSSLNVSWKLGYKL